MDVGFIPGIYNYCDRWCEKCEQQLRCMSFVMGKKIEEKGGFNFEREGHREDESIWARLKEVFESTYEVLHELAEERGLNVEDIYASENIDRELEKLICYCMDRETIEEEQVEAICVEQTENKIFEMINAISEKRQKQAQGNL